MITPPSSQTLHIQLTVESESKTTTYATYKKNKMTTPHWSNITHTTHSRNESKTTTYATYKKHKMTTPPTGQTLHLQLGRQ